MQWPCRVELVEIPRAARPRVLPAGRRSRELHTAVDTPRSRRAPRARKRRFALPARVARALLLEGLMRRTLKLLLAGGIAGTAISGAAWANDYFVERGPFVSTATYVYGGFVALVLGTLIALRTDRRRTLGL